MVAGKEHSTGTDSNLHNNNNKVGMSVNYGMMGISPSASNNNNNMMAGSYLAPGASGLQSNVQPTTANVLVYPGQGMGVPLHPVNLSAPYTYGYYQISPYPMAVYESAGYGVGGVSGGGTYPAMVAAATTGAFPASWNSTVNPNCLCIGSTPSPPLKPLQHSVSSSTSFSSSTSPHSSNSPRSSGGSPLMSQGSPNSGQSVFSMNIRIPRASSTSIPSIVIDKHKDSHREMTGGYAMPQEMSDRMLPQEVSCAGEFRSVKLEFPDFQFTIPAMHYSNLAGDYMPSSPEQEHRIIILMLSQRPIWAQGRSE